MCNIFVVASCASFTKPVNNRLEVNLTPASDWRAKWSAYAVDVFHSFPPLSSVRQHLVVWGWLRRLPGDRAEIRATELQVSSTTTGERSPTSVSGCACRKPVFGWIVLGFHVLVGETLPVTRHVT